MLFFACKYLKPNEKMNSKGCFKQSCFFTMSKSMQFMQENMNHKNGNMQCHKMFLGNECISFSSQILRCSQSTRMTFKNQSLSGSMLSAFDIQSAYFLLSPALAASLAFFFESASFSAASFKTAWMASKLPLASSTLP